MKDNFLNLKHNINKKEAIAIWMVAQKKDSIKEFIQKMAL